MPEPFVLDAEFADAVHKGLRTKRKDRKPDPLGCSCFVVAFWLPIALLAFIIIGYGLIEEWTNRLNWIETQAVIVDCVMEGRTPHAIVTYSYSVINAEGASDELTTTEMAANGNCDIIATMTTIRIEYLSHNPRRSHISEPGLAETPAQHMAFYAALLLPGIFGMFGAGVGIVGIVRHFTYKQNFESESMLITGEIISCERKFTGKKREQCFVEVTYQFKYPETVHTGKQIKEREDLREKHLPAPGTPVLVAYIDAKHYRML